MWSADKGVQRRAVRRARIPQRHDDAVCLGVACQQWLCTLCQLVPRKNAAQKFELIQTDVEVELQGLLPQNSRQLIYDSVRLPATNAMTLEVRQHSLFKLVFLLAVSLCYNRDGLPAREDPKILLIASAVRSGRSCTTCDPRSLIEVLKYATGRTKCPAPAM